VDDWAKANLWVQCCLTQLDSVVVSVLHCAVSGRSGWGGWVGCESCTG